MTTATGPSSVQDTPPDAAHDPRFPWKIKGTRKPLPFWDRIKFLLLFAVVFALLVWNEFLRITPLGGWNEAARDILQGNVWLPVIAGVTQQQHAAVIERLAL